MKISPTKRTAMGNMITKSRLTGNVSNPNPVKEIKPINTNHPGMSSDAGALNKEYFYDSLEKKEKEIKKKKFSKQNTQKEKSIYTISKEDKETIDFLKSIFIKFNTAIDNVKRIDLARNENNFLPIKQSLQKNSCFLASLGIMNDKLSHFYINEEVFVREIMKNPKKLKQLLDTQTGVIRKLHDSFGGML